MYYGKWRYEFGDAIDFRIVQYPFREQRMNVPMPASLPSLAEDVFAAFIGTFRGPYAIWGHSMGAIVGYEVAKLCQRRLDNPPMVFFGSASAAPNESRFKRAAMLDDEEGLNEILRHYGGIGEENLRDAEFMKYFSPIISADLQMLATYEETGIERLRCPLVLMKGLDDRADMDGWKLYAGDPPEFIEFPGGHFFLEDCRSQMASIMETRIRLLRQSGDAAADRCERDDPQVRDRG